MKLLLHLHLDVQSLLQVTLPLHFLPRLVLFADGAIKDGGGLGLGPRGGCLPIKLIVALMLIQLVLIIQCLQVTVLVIAFVHSASPVASMQ